MFKLIFSELRLYLCNEWISELPSHRLRRWYYRKVMKFEIGNQSNIFMHCTFDSARGFSIGDKSVINQRCRLDSRGKLTIGNNVSISQEVVILTADHDLETPDFAGRNKEVIIDDYVWIGTRATILPGVKVGKGVLVAAGAVVSKDIPPYSVVAGVPARVIKMRPDNLQYNAVYRRLFQ